MPLRFTDTTAEVGKKHAYRVTAVNAAGLIDAEYRSRGGRLPMSPV